MSTAFIIGAAALALGAVIVALFLPARARDHEPAMVAAAGDGQPTDSVPVAAAAGDGQRTNRAAVADGDGERRAAPAPDTELR
jgi:hypothetical protein